MLAENQLLFQWDGESQLQLYRLGRRRLRSSPRIQGCPMAGFDIDRLKAEVPCSTLLEKDGWKVDLRESTPRAIKFRRAEGEIIIVVHQGRGWFDPTSEAKGDVLSLAQRLGACDFGAALKAVADLVGVQPTAPAWQRKSRPTRATDLASRWAGRAAPASHSAAWEYLTNERAIPPAIISSVIAAGRLREGPKGSMWAAHTSASGQVVGWEERGPSWRGFASGGSKTLFTVGDAEALRVCVVEAAIDAMSLAALEDCGADTQYASTGGGWSPSTADRIFELALRPGARLVAAFDGNDQGDAFAARLKEIAMITGVNYLRLWPEAEDWNDQLRQQRRAGAPTG